MSRTKHIDGMCADYVLCELHVHAMAYHNQWSLVGSNNCSDVRCCDPAPFRRYNSATRCIMNGSPSYKPLDLCRWVAVRCSTCEGHWIAYPSLCWTWDANLSWSNCVGKDKYAPSNTNASFFPCQLFEELIQKKSKDVHSSCSTQKCHMCPS